MEKEEKENEKEKEEEKPAHEVPEAVEPVATHVVEKQENENRNNKEEKGMFAHKWELSVLKLSHRA